MYKAFLLAAIFKIYWYVIKGGIYMVKGIEHIAIFARDTAALKEWYVKMFDFKQVYENDKGTYFLKAQDGAMIEFVKTEENGGILGDKISGIRHIAIAVDDFEAMVDTLMNDRVEVVAKPLITPKGLKTFFFRDPEGNVLHLIYRPEAL